MESKQLKKVSVNIHWSNKMSKRHSLCWNLTANTLTSRQLIWHTASQANTGQKSPLPLHWEEAALVYSVTFLAALCWNFPVRKKRDTVFFFFLIFIFHCHFTFISPSHLFLHVPPSLLLSLIFFSSSLVAFHLLSCLWHRQNSVLSVTLIPCPPTLGELHWLKTTLFQVKMTLVGRSQVRSISRHSININMHS